MSSTVVSSASRPALVTMTETAAARVKELLAKAEGPVIGLRVGVRARGCSGMSYTFDYTNEKKPLDEVITDKGATVIIDSAAVMYLIGAEMDYTDNGLQSGFTFRNPNEKSRCGCGESFQA